MRGITIFRLLKDKGDKILEAQPLSTGEHIIVHAGARVRVRIGEDDSVTVFLGDYQGDSRDLFLAGFDGDAEEQALLRNGKVRAVEIRTAPGDTAVALMGVYQDVDTCLALTPLSEAPVLGVRARR